MTKWYITCKVKQMIQIRCWFIWGDSSDRLPVLWPPMTLIRRSFLFGDRWPQCCEHCTNQYWRMPWRRLITRMVYDQFLIFNKTFYTIIYHQELTLTPQARSASPLYEQYQKFQNNQASYSYSNNAKTQICI